MAEVYAIKVDGLTKKFNDFTAVDNISFSVKTGELFGLLGPNGAGKTTTINILATLLKPTICNAEVAGHNICSDKEGVRRDIGIVFQEPALDIKLTGRENLDFHSMMYGLGKRERGERIEEVLNLIELTDKADVLVENYSGGMKRRLEIARGLIQKPKVLFLDEPTLGLDAQTRRHIWEYLRKLNRDENVTIILTTHYMEEADYLCDRTAIIDYSKIIALDTPANLKDLLGGDVVSIEVDGDMDALTNYLKSIEWIKTVKKHDSNLSLTMEHGEKRIPELINIAQKNNATVTSVNLHKPSLEDVFIYFTGKSIRSADASQQEKNRDRMRTHGGH